MLRRIVVFFHFQGHSNDHCYFLPNCFRIVFYHRVSPTNDLDLFMYIVLVECWNVTPQNLIHVLDFVQRMRVERLNGYISLYRYVTHFN